jgi:endonuclease/exonuclease/phosphatase family metal-dependent hydrolase
MRDTWRVPQIGISLLAIWASRAARGHAKDEPFEPANLTLWNGLSFGAFLFLEMALLAMPNVAARWANVNYGQVAIWFALASALTLNAGLRRQVSRPLEVFDERSRAWIWILLLILLIVLGNHAEAIFLNRIGGLLAASALVIAQVVTLMIVWWVPDEVDPRQTEQVGPAVTFALAFYVILSYAYLLVFEDVHVFLPLRGQTLTLHLVAVVILGLVLVGWRDPDPWRVEVAPQRGLPLAFAVLMFVGTTIAVRPLPVMQLSEGEALRFATYDIHHGYGPTWRYDLELTARSIEVAQPDVVALQRVDVGRQSSYGVDQVIWLARRLRMNHVYYPTVEQLTGLAILSHWPILDEGGVLFAGQGEQMGVAYALVGSTSGSRTVGVYSTRLAPDDEDRLIQVGGLLGYIGNVSPVVLNGNLWLTAGDDGYAQLTVGGLSDPNDTLDIVEDFTYPASNPIRRFDYVLLRGLTPVDSQKVCGDQPASDHCLIVIEVLPP